MKVVLILKDKTYHIFESCKEAEKHIKKNADYHYCKRENTYKVYCDIKDFNCEHCSFFGNCKFQEM